MASVRSLRGTPIGVHIFNELKRNLNTWKRVEGLDDAANLDFYDNIFTREVMDAVTELTGTRYPDWGTTHKGYQIGGMFHGKPVPIGLRWTATEEEWMDTGRDANAKTMKTMRHTDQKSNFWRPQLVVMLKDPKIYQKMRDECTDVSGGKTKAGEDRRKFNAKAVEKSGYLERTEIIPIQFSLRSIGRVMNNRENVKRASGVHRFAMDANDDSRHQMDDHQVDDATLQRRIDEDNRILDQIELKTRKAITMFASIA